MIVEGRIAASNRLKFSFGFWSVLATMLVCLVEELWVHHEALVPVNDALVVCWLHHVVTLRHFMLRNHDWAHVWRPKVLRGLTLASEALLKLARVKHISEDLGCGFTCNHQRLLDIFIEPEGGSLEQGALRQRHVDVVAAV